MLNNKPVYKTLTPRDAQFQSYLMGDFSEKERAIALPGLNLQTVNEVVTFEIRPLENLEKGSVLQKTIFLLKPGTWLTVLVPLLVVRNLGPETSWSATLWLGWILLLTLTFANWRSDLADHIEGWDRLQGGQSHNVLQNGWFTGFQIKKWGWRVLGSALLFVVPLIKSHPWVLFLYALGVLSLLLLLPRWWRMSSMPGVSSFILFLLTGPLLATGIDITLNHRVSSDAILVGVMWGLWMSFLRQQKMYTKQWYVHQRKPSSFFIGLGFDRSKALMRLLIPTVPVIMILISLFLKGGAAWFFPLTVVHLIFISLELPANEKIQSSIGSHLQTLQTLFRWHYWALALVLVLGSLLWSTVA